MRPSEVRERILADHESIRKMLEELEAAARGVLAGERRLLGPLRDRGEALLARLEEHMHWEDRYLSAALREADAWGAERAALLDREHREQRVMLRDTLKRIRANRRPATAVARDLADLVARLRIDMEQEERDLVDERVLRDDVIGIDVETG